LSATNSFGYNWVHYIANQPQKALHAMPPIDWSDHIKHPSQVFVALDTDTPQQAFDWVAQLAPQGFKFKVGMQLYYRVGMSLVQQLQQSLNADVFVDLKLHDIPNTVQQAARAVASQGASFFNIHAQGGKAMMQAARRGGDQGAQDANASTKPVILAVTLLTSLDDKALRDELAVSQLTPMDYVVHLARLAQDSGLDGVVCSAHEAQAVLAACGPDFLRVTPGIRLPEDDAGDQSRVLTPQAALAAGASHLVMGRSITGQLP
jgi:orotidine-5'-phosphate decarboxylase